MAVSCDMQCLGKVTCPAVFHSQTFQRRPSGDRKNCIWSLAGAWA